jgi:hypothetical protein
MFNDPYFWAFVAESAGYLVICVLMSLTLYNPASLCDQENGKLWEQLWDAQADAAVWRSKCEDMWTEVQDVS